MVHDDRVGRDTVAESQKVGLGGKPQAVLLLGQERHQAGIAPCHRMFSANLGRPQDGLYRLTRAAHTKPSLAVPCVGTEFTVIFRR